VHKLSHAISDASNYKGKNWRSWLLYYSISVCLGSIPKTNLFHALLVKCIYILSKSEITITELNTCEEDLMKLVALFEVLYAESMRFNVHMLLHVVQSVRMSGPLWATSAFLFENNIYFLKQLVNGPKGVEQQIAKKFL